MTSKEVTRPSDGMPSANQRLAAAGDPRDTPMMRQFHAAKSQHPDEVLFFRMGDFYEMFFDDARLVSELLGITLTSRSKDRSGSGQERRWVHP